MSQRNIPDDDASEQALGIEILKVVMNYCNDGLKAEWNYFNEEVKYERAATNAKILKLSEILSNKVESVKDVIKAQQSTLADIN